MKAISRARLDRRVVQELLFRMGGVNFSIVRCSVPVCVCRWRITISRGKELIRV